jgi:hypothetical protein
LNLARKANLVRTISWCDGDLLSSAFCPRLTVPGGITFSELFKISCSVPHPNEKALERFDDLCEIPYC